MDIAEFQQRLNDTINEIEANRESEALIIVNDALRLIKRRVINSGTKADGSTFGDYSDTLVPVWFFKEKESRAVSAYDKLYQAVKAGNKGAKVKRKSRKDDSEYTSLEASYTDWRDVNNLPTEFKNFSFTGRTWQSVLPEITLRSESRVVVTVQATDPEAIKKLEYVSAQSGNILEPNQVETDMVFKANEQRWQKVLNKNFL
jgi:hypothetical protein